MVDDDDAISSSDGELFQIIDETGEGWGFDLNLSTVARPLTGLSVGLVTAGLAAGIPLGIWVGRPKKGEKQVRPSFGHYFFALRAFTAGTALCCAFGGVGLFFVRRYYSVDTFDEFGSLMREIVPKRKRELEIELSPLINRVRDASESLSGPFSRIRSGFQNSRAGIWLRERLDASAVVPEDQSDDSDAQRG